MYRRKEERGRGERFLSGRGECARDARGAVLWFIRRGCGLSEDVADLRLELGIKSRSVEAELVLVVLGMLNS